MRLLLHRLPSPVGVLRLATLETRLAALDYFDCESRFQTLLKKRFPQAAHKESRIPAPIRDALGSYFAGDESGLRALSLEQRGTEFEERVWAALRTVPFGETASYGVIAKQIGLPKAARAVGRANSLNPIAIITPCHRIIGSSGALTGYAGCLWRKKWLLQHEAANNSEPIETRNHTR